MKMVYINIYLASTLSPRVFLGFFLVHKQYRIYMCKQEKHIQPSQETQMPEMDSASLYIM